MTITAIIPTYNRKELLLRAIISVINQVEKVDEIIVVDDGSTDGTEQLFPMRNIIYKKIEHTGYPGRVRNIGVNLSTSQYIAFLDSDDEWLPYKIYLQKQFIINNPKCKILHGLERWIMNGKIVSQKKRKHKRSGNIFPDSLQGCIIGPSTVLMLKDLYLKYNGFKDNIEIGEDYDLWLRITNSHEIDYIEDEIIIKYAGHGDQLSFKYDYIEPFKIDVLEELINRYDLKDENRKLAIDSLVKKYDIVIEGCIKRRKIDAAKSYNNKKTLFLNSI
ncbi:MAG: glycosyltransferase family 2 protein [Spirochaetales bacterium]|nr:glycosyltransferase family 2 protein [Spirochaetales bacterium]